MTVYIAPEVADVIALHPDLNRETFRALSIRDQIAAQAETLVNAHREGDRRLRMQVMCWWPGVRGLSLDDVMATSYLERDARLTVAREYGFVDWGAVEALGGRGIDPDFESALDALVLGDVAALSAKLEASPALATERSRYGHAATLLHYIGANGVESHRQKTPLNAAELAELLIAHGADPRAEANVYGGGQTPHSLASTSAHPLNAGISEALNAVLFVG